MVAVASGAAAVVPGVAVAAVAPGAAVRAEVGGAGEAAAAAMCIVITTAAAAILRLYRHIFFYRLQPFFCFNGIDFEYLGFHLIRDYRPIAP